MKTWVPRVLKKADMRFDASRLCVRRAVCDADLAAAQRLRYAVFVSELGGAGGGVDHNAGLEADHFDRFADHLLLEDLSRPENDRVIGVYRVMDAAMAAGAGGFYCAAEFDLTALETSGRRLLELGRSCLHPDYRGGPGMFHLWAGLARYVADKNADVLFGVASFHGTDVASLAAPLSFLADRHSAPATLTALARAPHAISMQIIPPAQIDRKAAICAIPALIKAYLRLGGTVGQGAYVDHAFRTTDVCLILDTARMNTRMAALYGV